MGKFGKRAARGDDRPLDRGQPTILEFVRVHLDPSGVGLLAGGEDLPGEDSLVLPGRQGLRWAPGARDGVAAHHMGVGVSDADVGELVTLIRGAIGSGLGRAEMARLYERLRELVTVSIVDELVGAVARSGLPRSGVEALGRRLASEGRDVEPVKAGIALLGVAGTSQDRELLLTLGQALLGALFLVQMRLTWWEAGGLFALWASQFALSTVRGLHVYFTAAYFLWATVEIVLMLAGKRRPAAFPCFAAMWRRYVRPVR